MQITMTKAQLKMSLQFIVMIMVHLKYFVLCDQKMLDKWDEDENFVAFVI